MTTGTFAEGIEAAARMCADWRCVGHEHDCGCALCGVARGLSTAIRALAPPPPEVSGVGACTSRVCERPGADPMACSRAWAGPEAFVPCVCVCHEPAPDGAAREGSPLTPFGEMVSRFHDHHCPGAGESGCCELGDYLRACTTTPPSAPGREA